MRRWLAIPLICLLASTASADQVYLDAHFNDKGINEPIGTGGAEVGEPYDVPNTITAIVREGPMGSPSLEIQDNHEHAGHAAFHLLGDVELTGGIVDISADLWFDSLADGDSCVIQITEHGSKTRRFAELIFRDNGSILLDYGDALSLGQISWFPAGSRFRVIFEFDMDAGTFDVWLSGVRIVDDLAHGITDRGIGDVHFGCLYDADQDGRFSVDAVSVTDYFQATPVEEHSWGRLKVAFR